jgi:threonine/homoserine/homoserine lactone efflux protein
MLNFLMMGLTFGLSIGMAPSPLLTLAITQPLSHSRKEGLKVVFTPLITDLPLLLVTASLYSRVTNLDLFLGIVSILGALFIGFLGWKNLNAKGLRFDKPKDRADSLRKGILANLLNPYPYIFWLTVGGPVLIDSFATGFIWGLSFIAGFYCMLVASRVVLILVVGKSLKFIKGNGYTLVLKVLGGTMVLFACKFFHEGIQRFL